jgi:hypothetical protein
MNHERLLRVIGEYTRGRGTDIDRLSGHYIAEGVPMGGVPVLMIEVGEVTDSGYKPSVQIEGKNPVTGQGRSSYFDVDDYSGTVHQLTDAEGFQIGKVPEAC